MNVYFRRRLLSRIFLSIIFLIYSPSFLSAGESSPPRYHIAISFDTASHSLSARATLHLEDTSALRLSMAHLRVSQITAENQAGESLAVTMSPDGDLLLPDNHQLKTLAVSYNSTFIDDEENQITPEGIVLLHSWLPIPDRPVLFSAEANIPENFQALWEADHFPLEKRGSHVSGSFSQPANELHLVAGPYQIASKKLRPDLSIHTLFFKEEKDLAEGYLHDAEEHIKRFEEILGPFPYHHYVIAANQKPTGLGLPTFTLLGQTILRLPFIRATSLGHEILHSWFGNSIKVENSQGNWCEGLTSYLADYGQREAQADGLAYRKESIISYLSSINEQTAQSLQSFHSATPHTPQEKAARAVGYNRATLFFHELREKIGDKDFHKAIHELARRKNAALSWDDLQKIFAAFTNENLEPFFSERLTRTDIPSFALENPQISATARGYRLSFTISQKTHNPYSLKIPLRIQTSAGNLNHTLHTDSVKQDYILKLPERPLALELDPEYSMLRQLEDEELPPTWSRFLGASQKMVVLESEESRSRFAPLLKALNADSWQIFTGSAPPTTKEMATASILFLGIDQEASRALFARPEHKKEGFTLDVRKNPFNSQQVAVLVSSSSLDETRAAAHRLSHYGGYSLLHFTQGKLTQKSVTKTTNGIRYQLEELPKGGATASLTDFSQIIHQLATKNVIYIGEQHDSVADHRLQLRILEQLQKIHPDISIGMEMFPASLQNALNRYVLSDTPPSEEIFLKESRYFSVWGYDYRLFREIFQLARHHKIPVIGLNIDKEISQSIFRSGGPEQLTAEEKARLPKDRDLDIQGYQERLRLVHSFHHNETKPGSEAGFLQAQALWDETMAEAITQSLQQHPGRIMVVLTGNEHARKDSGIPPRVARRIAVQQATVVNANTSENSDLAQRADYFFYPEDEELPEQGKLGLVLEERQANGQKHLEVVDFSETSKAKEAGLAVGDILRLVNAMQVSNMEDIRIAMLDQRVGDRVALKVQREKDEIDCVVELTVAAPKKAHSAR